MTCREWSRRSNVREQGRGGESGGDLVFGDHDAGQWRLDRAEGQGVRDPVSLYLEARNYIDVEIVRHSPRRGAGEEKVRVVREFNRRLGDPQGRFPAIQVAGTSGKGSVATLIARILRNAGFRTGLHISPYLQVATEKTWIDGSFVDPIGFHTAWREVFPVAEEFRRMADCPSSVHGMASLAMTWLPFRDAALDWAVVETGVGGRFDLVQGLNRKLAVITDLGHDHVKTLGLDLKTIAWHKAGIMEGCELAVAVRDPVTWPVLVSEAERYRCHLLPVVPEELEREVVAYSPLPLTSNGWCLTRGAVQGKLDRGPMHFPTRNKAVALAAVRALILLGLKIDEGHVAKAFMSGPGIAGRLETVCAAPQVVLDGAHNKQKMEALVRALPRPKGRTILVMGVTGERELAQIARKLPIRPDALFLTRALLYGKKTADPVHLKQQLDGWARKTWSFPAPIPAMRAALDAACPDDLVLVTGSLYLVGQVRNLWYPWREVLIQRTSFPQSREDEAPLDVRPAVP